MTTSRASAFRAYLVATAGVATLAFAFGRPAMAMEEVTATGTTNLVVELKADFEAEMASYARAVELDLRNTVLDNLNRSGAPTIRLARANGSHRG